MIDKISSIFKIKSNDYDVLSLKILIQTKSTVAKIQRHTVKIKWNYQN